MTSKRSPEGRGCHLWPGSEEGKRVERIHHKTKSLLQKRRSEGTIGAGGGVEPGQGHLVHRNFIPSRLQGSQPRPVDPVRGERGVSREAAHRKTSRPTEGKDSPTWCCRERKRLLVTSQTRSRRPERRSRRRRSKASLRLRSKRNPLRSPLPRRCHKEKDVAKENGKGKGKGRGKKGGFRPKKKKNRGLKKVWRNYDVYKNKRRDPTWRRSGR